MKPVILVTTLGTLSTLLAFSSAQTKTPNAADYVKSATKLLKSDSSDFVSTDPNLKREAVKKNAAVLRRFREGLAFEYSHTSDPNGGNVYLTQTRSIARLLVAEGEVHLADGKAHDAVSSFLDALRLGQEIPRGEPGVGLLVGMEIESFGRTALRKAIPTLDAPTARQASLRLQLLNARRLPYIETLRIKQPVLLQLLNEAESENVPAVRAKRLADFRTMMKQEMTRATLPYVHNTSDAQVDKIIKEKRPTESATVTKTSQAIIRRTYFMSAKTRVLNSFLAVALALHAWKQEKGFYPETLTELAPRYLEHIPRDSFGNGAPLRYAKKGDTYVLYSVGPDGKNDLGRAIVTDTKSRTVRSASKGDIVSGVNLR